MEQLDFAVSCVRKDDVSSSGINSDPAVAALPPARWPGENPLLEEFWVVIAGQVTPPLGCSEYVLRMIMHSEQKDYAELCYYTLAHGDPTFIHQHVVDAFAAQTANETDQPIKLTFALIGLCLYIEKQFTGRQIQKVHMKLGHHQRDWPIFSLPKSRGTITVKDVLAASAGAERDRMIHQWCTSVWAAYQEHQESIKKLLREYQIFT